MESFEKHKISRELVFTEELFTKVFTCAAPCTAGRPQTYFNYRTQMITICMEDRMTRLWESSNVFSVRGLHIASRLSTDCKSAK